MPCLFLALAAGLGTLAPAAEESPPADAGAGVEIRAKVLDPDGKPAAGVRVLLVGVEPECLMDPDTAAKSEGWNFITGPDGTCAIRLGAFASEELLNQKRKWLPGWGDFFLVVAPDGKYAGAVSPRLIHPGPSRSESEAAPDAWGRPMIVAANTQIELPIRRGLTVTGQVHNVKGEPFAGLPVELYFDLGARNRTGFGGEIFRQTSKSDRHGYVEFRNVFPSRFFLDFEGGPPYWVQTRVGDSWKDGIVDEFTPHPKAREFLFGMVVSNEKINRYFGRVTTAVGNPIANARIILGVSKHRRIKSERDRSEFVETVTGADGRYEIKTETPWVWGFQVEASGYNPLVKEQPDRMYAPGEHHFHLSR